MACGIEVSPQGYVYAQSVECEEPCERRLSRTVLWEGEGETPSLYSTSDSKYNIVCSLSKHAFFISFLNGFERIFAELT